MAQREARIRFEAGDGGFLLASLSGTESMSLVHSLHLTVLHPNHTVAFLDILGTRATVEIDAHDGAARYIDGFVADLAYRGPLQDMVEYTVTLVPWLWFLGRGRDSRIFQNMTVPEIVAQVFARYSLADHVERLGETYQTRPYCVQYRESDLDFVSRLMEDEGICFFFEHSDGAHRLVMTDPAMPPRPGDGYATVPYYPPDPDVTRERDHIDAWQVQARVRPGKATLRAFDFTKPRADLQAEEADPRQHRQADAEVYDYPGGYLARGHGETIARTRLEELQADTLRSLGAGNAAGLCCGARFTLSDFPRQDQNIDWLVLSVDHEIRVEGPRTRSGGETEQSSPYRCRVAVQDCKLPFRPPRITPRPFVHGPQTAIVTGPAGEEIYTDTYGRVKLQFHWDRLGKKDANTSCWVRVSNAWAGSGFGGIHIPRIGQEVIVDFLEGDPDQPIITGRVYNAGAMPPYALPGKAIQSGLKTNSSKGGGGSNELRMDDTKGSEEVYLHAQKDENIVVEHDKTETVHHDEHITIDNDRTELVGHDETMTVKNNRTRSVLGNETVAVTGSQTVSVHGARVDTVDQTETRTVKAGRIDTVMVNEARTVMGPQEQTVLATRTVVVALAQSHAVGAGDSWAITGGQTNTITGGQTNTIIGGQTNTITGDQTTNITGSRSVSTTASDSLQVGADRSANVTGADSHTIGKTLVIDVGDTVTLTAKNSITFQTGKATITMKSDGTVTVDGKDITQTASGEISAKASGNITQKGSKILQN